MFKQLHVTDDDLKQSNWFVAFYLRKSRGEEDKDLDKHRWLLMKIASKYGWKFKEYTEVANSETIKYRPKFQQLLKDIQDGMFNAVLVVDYERLGRGDLEDQALVKRVFRDSSTFIVTPEKIYNPLDDTDDLLIDVRGLLARQAYKTIKYVLQRGKVAGSAQGHWTNGIPPFPYKRNPARKRIEVDPEWNELYQSFKEMLFSGMNLTEIMVKVNRDGKRTPKGKTWAENTIRRILIDETHLGRIITNKSEGSAHKNKNTKPLMYKPREEWVVVENCHESVKTIEEHEKILVILERRRRIPHRAREGGYLLSGLVYCGYCKKCCQFDTKKGNYVYTRACRKPDPFGVKCNNRMITEKLLLTIINDRLQSYEGKILAAESLIDKDRRQYLEVQITQYEQDLEKQKRALRKVKQMNEEGEYTEEEYRERKADREKEILRIQKEIEKLLAEIDYEERITNEERISKIGTFKEVWSSSATTEAKNKIAKEVIQRITYTRDDADNVNIEITFH